MWNANDLAIGTVRVRGARRSSPALAAAVGGQLRAADLRPPGMPPSAVLIVRQLADPLPGKVALRPGAGRPDPRWERAARERIGELYRRAASPAAGPVPAGAEAVRFADEAEMLAHLALDLARGRAAACWWWRSVLSRLRERDLASVLVRHGRQVPAAFSCLAACGELAAVGRRLAPAQAVEVLRAVVEAHGLDRDLLPPGSAERGMTGARKSDRSDTSDRSDRSDTSDGADRSDSSAAPRRSALRSAEPPWRGWLSGAQSGTAAPEVERLLGVALALVRAPALFRSASITRPLSEAAPDSPLEKKVSSSPFPADGPVRKDPAGNDPVGCSAPESSTPAAGAGASPAPRVLEPPEPGAEPRTDGPAPRSGVRGRSRPRSAEPPVEQERDGDERGTGPEPPQPAAPTLVGIGRPSFEEGVDTELGGVLYLVNLMVHLELPERFADAGAWGLLELLARALLPPLPEPDPLWDVLAELDGRPSGIPPAARAGRRLAPEVPAIRRRIEEALGADGGAVADLLRLRARLYAGPTHVDLVARLDGVSLPARIAGLDRDPGWVPAFGRVVLFHFE